jgi:outer membrane cobalamin receptor
MVVLKGGRLIAPAFLLLGIAGPVYSSENDQSGDEFRYAGSMESVVVTATRTEASVLEVADAISAIDSTDISRLAPELLAEMLRGVPGAFFQQTTPGQGIPIIRGLKGSQVLHLVDGMRLNNAFFRNAPNHSRR